MSLLWHVNYKYSYPDSYFVKWRNLPYDQCTWERKKAVEKFSDAIERFEIINSADPRYESNVEEIFF